MTLARSKKVRNSARGESCTLRFYQVCNDNPDTVIFAHVGSQGGMGMKCGDNFGVYACSSCHDLIDGRIKSPNGNYDFSSDILRALEETQQKLIDKELMVIR
ncbi:protein of unknown function DUF1364 [Vibrio phage 199E37-1]|nr:protein of unknown function DUF1364 [Vibrio phage 199E37-1]